MTNSLCGRIDRFEIEHRSYGTAIYLDAHPLAVEHLRLLLKAQRVSFDRTGRKWTFGPWIRVVDVSGIDPSEARFGEIVDVDDRPTGVLLSCTPRATASAVLRTLARSIRR